ncbi:MAG: hypothetical protein IPO38_09530 [Rhodocyclaceae bacterium]|nr:hypothetical protein [Rhodocyclaceae bacterium]
MNNADIRNWYEFSKIQIAAESYLDLFIAGDESLSQALRRGNTNWVPGSATDTLYTKLTQSQTADFIESHQIIAELKGPGSNCFC